MSEVKNFGVILPVVGYAYMEVEAENSDAALDKAYDLVSLEHIEEWDSPNQIVEGNVFHGQYNAPDVEEL